MAKKTNDVSADPGDVRAELKDLRSRLQDIVSEVAGIEGRMQELEAWQMMEGAQALRETILVVDDSRLVRTLMRGILKDVGYQVVEAESSAEALDYLAAQTCDLIIVDIFMPDAGGSDLVREIRLTQKKVDLPVLVCSASRDKIDYQRIGQFGVQGILQKPVKKNDLIDKVGEILHLATLQQKAPEGAFDPKVFDLQAALENTGGDGALLRDLAGTFLSDSSRLLAAIRRAVVGKDSDALKQASHSYKGAAAVVGGAAAASAAVELEAMASTDATADARDGYARLESAQRDLKDALESFLRT